MIESCPICEIARRIRSTEFWDYLRDDQANTPPIDTDEVLSVHDALAALPVAARTSDDLWRDPETGRWRR